MSSLGRPRRRPHQGLATQAVTAGRPPRQADGPLAEPPVFSSTLHAGGPVAYGRDGNATWTALESALGAIDGGSALTFASGMAAITAVLETLPVGATVVAPRQAYSVARGFLQDRAAAGRLQLREVDIADTEAVLRACRGASLLWMETVTNPLLDVADVAALADGARLLDVVSVCDNTFLSPYLYRPIEHGVDIVVHSVTKFIAGHSDVLLGAVITRPDRPDLCDAVRRKRSLYGGIAGPMEAWLALRGLRTLHVRMERACENAAVLAERLEDHPQVAGVRYPGLASHPQHDRARRLFGQEGRYGAMVSFEVRGGPEAAEAMCNSCALAVHATSLGGVETTLERRRRWKGESESTPSALVRMSVGIEDVEDLWTDLARALDLAARVRVAR